MLAKAKIEAGFSGCSIAGPWVQDSESVFVVLENLYSADKKKVLCMYYVHAIFLLNFCKTYKYSLLCNLNCFLTCQLKLGCLM
jgi:hypothetical protein